MSLSILSFLSYSMFMDKVEVHIAHVQNGLGQVGNLHAFTNSASNMSFM